MPTKPQPAPDAAITLRPAAFDTEDLEFLYRVYASTRQTELAQVPWSDAEKETFLRQQFGAQHTFYQQQFPTAEYAVIERNGQPVGRFYLDRRADELRVIDIAILPDHQRAGIGGRLMQRAIDEASALGKPVRIHVERENPAMHLYERLGFHRKEDKEVYWLMEWTP